MELPPWPKQVDPWLQRTAWGLAITLGILTLLVTFIIPYYEAFMVTPYFAAAAGYAYLWHKNRGILNSWSIQYVFTPYIVVSFIEAFRYAGRGGAYSSLVSCLWLVSAAAWTVLSMRAAYEKYVFLWGFLAKLMSVAEMQQKRLNMIQGVEYNEEFSKAFQADMQKSIDLMPPGER